MAALAIIIGSLFGGGLVGATLYLWDPLGARRNGAGEDGRSTAAQALHMLGYSDVDANAAASFQKDANFVLAWEREPTTPAMLGDPPPVLAQIASGPDLAPTGILDDPTVTFLLAAARAVVLVTGQPCMTAAVMQSHIESCKAAWQEAVRYAYQAKTVPEGMPDAKKVILTYVPMPQNGGGHPGPGLVGGQ